VKEREGWGVHTEDMTLAPPCLLIAACLTLL
jgi:hypothetical protein